ncbi:MAG: hypothetical protein FWF79_02295 [Defluviitaleaceae bacterium]|nr:hypothetical protein [Defluviitaleaceae bacterium]
MRTKKLACLVLSLIMALVIFLPVSASDDVFDYEQYRFACCDFVHDGSCDENEEKEIWLFATCCGHASIDIELGDEMGYENSVMCSHSAIVTSHYHFWRTGPSTCPTCNATLWVRQFVHSVITRCNSCGLIFAISDEVLIAELPGCGLPCRL